MSLLVWLPLNGNLNTQGLCESTPSGTPAYLTGKLGGQAYDLSKRCTFNIPALTGLKTWSVAFWYITNTDGNLSANWMDVLGLGDRSADDTTNGDFRFEVSYGTSKRGIGCYDSGTYATYTSNMNTLVSGFDAWHHICVTVDYENNTCIAYVDGVSTVTKTHGGGWLRGNLWLGEANKINGAIQDVRIYNHALSKKEVKELTKGLCMHLPLDWGGNPNMIKNSYTWMNGNLGTTNAASATMVVTKSVINSDSAPCAKVFHVQGVNSSDSASVGSVGPFFTIANKGLTTNDLVSGETYTYSFWARLVEGSTGTITLSANEVCESQTMISNSGFTALTTDWRKHTVTFRWTSTTKLTNCFYTSYPANSTVIWEVCGLKLEKSSVATPYLPHVEEDAYTSGGYATMPFEDKSGYGRNGTNVGSTNGGTSPRGSSCIYQQTANQVNLTPLFTTTGVQVPELSVSIWVKCTTLNSTSPQLWSLGQNSFIRCRIPTNGTDIWHYCRVGADATVKSSAVTVGTLTDGSWHHVVLTFKDGIMKTYYDSVLKGTNNHSGSGTYLKCNQITKWLIGAYDASSESMNGYLSDFRIYARCLTDDEVKELYQIPVQIDKVGNMYCNSMIEE